MTSMGGRARLVATAAVVGVLAILATVGVAAHSATQAHSTTLPGPRSTPGTTKVVAGPSVSARMICGAEIQHSIATLAGLRSVPSLTSTWVDHVYTCTYQLPSGTLKLSVDDASDTASATAYFIAVNQRLGPTTALTGLSDLGLPAYESQSGAVIFLKDAKTLEVDARGLRGYIGSSHETPRGVAYTIATDVLGCWTGA